MAASILSIDAARLLAPLLLIHLIVCVNKCQSKDETIVYDAEDPVADYLLCRECGADVVDAGYIVNKASPEGLVITNQTIFGIRQVDVQYLTNPFGFSFSTVALSKAGCYGRPEEWHEEFTWYPGYAWKNCFCRRGHLLGWIFEPIATAKKDRIQPSSDGFFLLILDDLLSEKFVDSLIVVPKLFKS